MIVEVPLSSWSTVAFAHDGEAGSAAISPSRAHISGISTKDTMQMPLAMVSAVCPAPNPNSTLSEELRGLIGVSLRSKVINDALGFHIMSLD